MTHLVFIPLSFIVFMILIIDKIPLLYWYKRLRIEIWHRWIIWKVERNLNNGSIESEKNGL
jgi:hypothetical protein